VRSGKDVFHFISVFALLCKTQGLFKQNTSFDFWRINYGTLFTFMMIDYETLF